MSPECKKGLDGAKTEGKTLGHLREGIEIEVVIIILEADGVKSRLAGDLRISQAVINKYLHAAGRHDLVGKDYKRAPVHAKIPAQNLPLEKRGSI